MPWTTPTPITPATKIADTDDIIETNATDLESYVNGTSPYSSSTGLTANMVDKATPQTITAQKTFTTAIVASGGVTGNVTGNLTGAADVATDSLALNGQVVTDSVISTSTTIPAALNSAKTAYDAGVQGQTDAATADTKAVAAQATADSKIGAADYATTSVGGTLKARVSVGVLYLTNNGVNA